MLRNEVHGRKKKKGYAQILRNGQNNQGFSLVEVLVAMAILAIISLPILNSFANAAQINARARHVENANTAVSDISEIFKARSIEDLKVLYPNYKRYSKDMVLLDDSAEEQTTDIYEFTVTNGVENGTAFYAGINGEQYDVTVTLDPSKYSDVTDAGNTSNNINSVGVASFSTMNTEENILIRDEIYKWDSWVLAELDREDITGIVKTVNIYTKVTGSGTVDGSIYNQSVSGTVVYTYENASGGQESIRRGLFAGGSDDNIGGTKEFTLTVTDGKLTPKNVYLMYVPYDTKSTTAVPTDITAYYATDKINIYYEYPNAANTATCDSYPVYIAQQKTLSTATATETHTMYLNRDLVSAYINGKDVREVFTNGTLQLPTPNGKVNIYSNIYEWNQYGATAGTTAANGIVENSVVNGAGSLYNMTIAVSLDGEDMAQVTTTKTN